MTIEDILNLPDSIRKTISLAGRQNRKNNPNHNLWDNNGTIYVHFTVHYRDHKAERIRFSLKTSSFEVARQHRDQIFAALGGERNDPAVDQPVLAKGPGAEITIQARRLAA